MNLGAAICHRSCSSCIADFAPRKGAAGRKVDLHRCRCGRPGALHAVDQHLVVVKASEEIARPTGVSANLVQLV